MGITLLDLWKSMTLPGCSHGGVGRDLPWELFWGWWRARWPARGGWCHWERDSLSPKAAHAGSSQRMPGVGARRETQMHTHAARPSVCAPNPFTQTWAESFLIKLWKGFTPDGLLTKQQSSSLPAFHLLLVLLGTSPHSKGKWQGRFPSSAYTAS